MVTVSVCFSVCLSASVSQELHVRSSPNFCACYLCPWQPGPPVAASLYYVLSLQLQATYLTMTATTVVRTRTSATRQAQIATTTATLSPP